MNLYRFLDELLNFESGVNWKKATWYEENFQRPVMRYWRVKQPGQLWRNRKTGVGMCIKMTVSEYFQSIGLSKVTRPLSEEYLKEARYRVINPWGFVGYQIGEARLIEAGYYLPKKIQIKGEPNQSEKLLPMYYTGGLPDSKWKNGCNRTVLNNPFTDQEMVATDVNYWFGKFTGKDGIVNFHEITKPERQNVVMKHLISENIALLHSLAGSENQLQALIENRSEIDAARYSLSGVLAAAHLSGTIGALSYLRSGKKMADETGTTVSEYLKKFSGF